MKYPDLTFIAVIDFLTNNAAIMAGTEELYDLSQLTAISRGNELFVKKMVAILCGDTPGMLQTMMDAYYAGDLEKMGEVAHRIKPSIDNLSITSIKQTIRDIEKMGSGDLPVIGLKETLDKVITTINEVIASLKTKYPA